MCQVVTNKRKGRPSKTDLTRRNAFPDYSLERDLRRSIRRRNVRYTFDYDDYIDDDQDEEADEENKSRREKKLELLMKLQVKGRTRTESAPSQSRRVTHAPTPSTSSSDYAGDSKPVKKRNFDSDDNDDIYEVKGRKSERKRAYSVPGVQGNTSSLPDNKSLELILDKLQKKDIYGVFAQPVDPEELPDYHDVIKHPMDFATVRRKLATGKYRTFAQFQHDVFLICKNAMKYNAPDTVYHKQALSIQELAKRKFERMKTEIGDSEKELKSERKPIPNSLPAKQMKKPINHIVDDTAGSDFTPGPKPPPAVGTHNFPLALRAVESAKPALADDFVESNAFFLDINSKKGDDEQEEKGTLPGFVRKPSVQDENRRETYQLSIQAIATAESIFEGEIKQLVPVGLEAEHSYARSLARFAATLGSAAWQVAAQRIEQALPPETKFGRGWVGEYEPLPTPVLMLQNPSLRESSFFTRSPCMNKGLFDDTETKTSVSKSQHLVTGHYLEGKSIIYGEIGNEVTNKEPTKTAVMGRNQSLFGSPRTKPADSSTFRYQEQIPPPNVFAETDKRVLNRDKQNGAHSLTESRSDFAAYGVRYQQQNQAAKVFVETDKKFINQVELKAAPSPDPGRSDFASQSVRYQLQQQSQCSETDIRDVNSIELNGGAPSLVNQRQADFGTQDGVRYQCHNQLARIFANPLELNGAPSPNQSQESFSTHIVNYQQQFPPTPMVLETRKKIKDELELNGAPSSDHYRSDLSDQGVRYQQLNLSAKDFAKNGKKVKNSLELNNPPSPNANLPNFSAHWQVSNNLSLPNSEPKESISVDRNLLQRQYLESAVEIQPTVHPVPSTRREDTNNAATTAARAWMSIGAAGGSRQDNTSSRINHIQDNSSHNHLFQDHQQQISRFRGEFPVNGMLFHPNTNRFPPVHGFVAPPHVRMGDSGNHQHPYNYHQMVFPQSVNRVQGGESISIHMPKQESKLHPDLNIGFQPSPARQSSSIDSQQPELALQL